MTSKPKAETFSTPSNNSVTGNPNIRAKRTNNPIIAIKQTTMCNSILAIGFKKLQSRLQLRLQLQLHLCVWFICICDGQYLCCISLAFSSDTAFLSSAISSLSLAFSLSFSRRIWVRRISSSMMISSSSSSFVVLAVSSHSSV